MRDSLGSVGAISRDRSALCPTSEFLRPCSIARSGTFRLIYSKAGIRIKMVDMGVGEGVERDERGVLKLIGNEGGQLVGEGRRKRGG